MPMPKRTARATRGPLAPSDGRHERHNRSSSGWRCNDVTMLPPELMRKGRFDELYGVYLPNDAERRDIFGIHLRLRGRDPDEFDVDRLSAESEAYTGADIKEVVQMGLKLAFHRGEPLDTDQLLEAIPEVRPLSKTDPEAVSDMTAWLDAHTKPAGDRHKPESVNGRSRRRRVTV